MILTGYFSYRMASVVGTTRLEMPRSLLQELEQALAEAAGINPMNHTVYEIKGSEDEQPWYIWFTNLSAFIGNSVELHPEHPRDAERVVAFDPPRIVPISRGLAR